MVLRIKWYNRYVSGAWGAFSIGEEAETDLYTNTYAHTQTKHTHTKIEKRDAHFINKIHKLFI